jgi:RNA polymerase sigma factor (sigma-70 family)
MTMAQAQIFADDRSALMAAAQAGEAQAYTALLRGCVPMINSVARRCGVPGDRLDDVVQEVLLTIHQARASYDPRRPFDAWLRVIAERRAIDLLRRAGRQGAREVHDPLAFEGHVDAAADPARRLDQVDLAGRIGRALAALPPRQREAVQHLVISEQSLGEAAAATGRTAAALKVNLHRALKSLRARMDRTN